MNQPVFEIQFQPLHLEGSVLRFPCDPQGHVDLDALNPVDMDDYLFARALVGRDYARPAVVATH